MTSTHAASCCAVLVAAVALLRLVVLLSAWLADWRTSSTRTALLMGQTEPATDTGSWGEEQYKHAASSAVATWSFG